MKGILRLTAATAALILVFAGTAGAGTRLILASTTSTQNSGLFNVLIPAYYHWTKLKDVRIDVVALGTGKAIATAQRGDADLLLVHDKDKEMKFLHAGYGIDRRDVMYNDFVIIGPPDDPAKVKSAKSAADAFRRIAASGAVFVSRGDQSGTNARELKMWKAADVDASKLGHYLSIGQGMGATLKMADEKAAYTLSDRGTYLAFKDGLKGVTMLYSGDPALFNQYGTMPVNPARFPSAHYKEAMDFINFITGPAGQKVIGDYKDRHGNRLFVPDAGK